ncbi:hypothetical protein AB0V79_31705 [Mesorhizobium ciceri]|uniref:Uncharacterized protein n=1 Tax=Mesorhizobium ciceri TaxID=39645 RepID=A0AB38TNQ1_9HYPH|nr:MULTISPECIES: hypothetical protein [Mesorhizobium]MBZ9892213.1 hypothetical protein [Mesorhizobium sp. BR1-1-3]MDF3218207.1 hypothetical protein [Mesorhizobium ciceri]MDF3233684.1 hypothetical protein [Mesorhizobium sp. DSM 30133]UTU55316.1 hypothetical protein LRP29_31900 [Mesorhizobium ciceri]
MVGQIIELEANQFKERCAAVFRVEQQKNKHLQRAGSSAHSEPLWP